MNIIEKYEQIKQEAYDVAHSSENIKTVSLEMKDVSLSDMDKLSKYLKLEVTPSNSMLFICSTFFWDIKYGSIAIWSVTVTKKGTEETPSLLDLYTTPPIIGDETKLD